MLHRGILCLAVAACVSCATPQPTPSSPSSPQAAGQIRILVFNIHAGKDAAGASNLERVADLIRSTDADLALVQEVDRRTKRSGNVDQLDVVARRAGYSAVFGRSLDYDGGQYGIAALSRAGFVAHFTEPLPVRPLRSRAGGSHEPRAALVVVARTGGGNLTALNTHLDASREEGYRLQEVDTVLKLVRSNQKSGLPAVAGGDFNAEPGSELYRRIVASGLRDAWTECGKGEGLTYPAEKPVKRIDYLFLADPLHCTDARVIETTISDHRPLLITIRQGAAQ
jgi:endonuclease/exonuclease/phosphatase family metal-dependent hydrolase